MIADTLPAQRRFAPEISLLGHAFVAFTVFLGAFVLKEPAPYEFAVLVSLSVAFLAGLRIPRGVVPLLMLLGLFLIGGFIAMFQSEILKDSVTYMAVSFYLILSSFFFACYVAEAPERRLSRIFNAWIVGGIVATLLGFVGYFNIGGLGETFSLYGRATGTFKDPNVLGAFLIMPAIWCVQRILTGRLSAMVLYSGAFVILSSGIFLSFSRGAWGQLALGAVLTAVGIFILNHRIKVRTRVIAMGVLGLIGIALLLMAALSIPAISELMEQRASLSQSYDTGHLGRFGRHVLGALMMMDHPQGIGPGSFAKIFGEDPHNAYLNAFVSYGWLGGFAFFGLTILTTVKLLEVIARTPRTRAVALPLFAGWLGLMIEATFIDVDHWRHFYLLLGLSWGLIAHAWKERRLRAFD